MSSEFILERNQMKELEIFPFYTDLTLEEKEELIALLKPFSLTKGSIVHYQGDVCENSLLLVKGTIRLYSQADDFSEELTLYTLKAGEQCLSKIMTGLNNISAIPSAVAETDIEAFLVNKEAIEAFIARIPVYQDYVISLYAKKIVELTTALQHIKFKNLDERIMDFLHKNERKTINITHNNLAEQMNTSRTVVSRVLKKLEEKGTLKLHRGYIEINS